MWRVAAAGVLCGAALAAHGQTAAAGPPTYFEFGTVVSIGQRTIDVQTFDQGRQRMVQHSFVLSRDSRADVVRIGDAVEVIYTTGVDWTVRRLMMLGTGIPQPGPPIEGGREIPKATEARLAQPLAQPAAAARVPTAGRPVLSAAGKTAAVPAAGRSVPLPTAIAGTKATPATSAVDLGAVSKGKPAPVIDVPLGAGEAALPRTPKARTVAREMPAEECNRSSADWPTQPLRLAVLDFRYPTDREESHDIGTTGGGSGTAVADLVFARLDGLGTYAMSRGDRTRLYRGDFAGAARVGRELGVDAVLAGTFQPVDPPAGSDPDFPPPKQYELRAGLVDTCTGQLLQRLTSVECPAGVDPNAASNGPMCRRIAVTARQASDPKDQAGVFREPIGALLYPLEHSGPPPGTEGSAGVVASVEGSNVTLKLPSGAQLHAGDQVSVHAWRLTKNPTTYTLQNLRDQEIGRVTVARAAGGKASGAFTGDFAPLPGDTAEIVPPQ